ncbi:MAG: hypothetical protein NZM26_00345 [Patescibacteria group bacterium]|nr:hypothetical protein [Patescibacteria group bacterium]
MPKAERDGSIQDLYIATGISPSRLQTRTELPSGCEGIPSTLHLMIGKLGHTAVIQRLEGTKNNNLENIQQIIEQIKNRYPRYAEKITRE